MVLNERSVEDCAEVEEQAQKAGVYEVQIKQVYDWGSDRST